MERPRQPRRPKLRWDRSMRQALCCLYRFFKCDKRQKEEIFFAMFRDNLRKRGICGFVPSKTLHTQWIWMRNTGDLVWSRVHKDTEFDMEGEWKNLIQRIKSTAVTLRLPLREKAEDDIDTSLWGTRVIVSGSRTEYPALAVAVNTSPPMTLQSGSIPETSHRIIFPPRQGEDQERSRFFAENDDQSSESITVNISHNQEQPSYTGSNQSVVTSHGKTCLWCEHRVSIHELDDHDDQDQHLHSEQNEDHDQSEEPQDQHQEQQEWDQQEHDQCQWSPHVKGHHDLEEAMQGVSLDKMPPLLYRWSNCDSQGINSKTYYRAGIFCTGEWFNPEDLSQSRFKSFFRSHVTKQKVSTPFISTANSPLVPIHRAIRSQNGAIVTVIDTSKLNTKVFHACPLAMRTMILKCKWKGHGEYLIWGQIPTEAIAFTLTITSLEEIANYHRDINRLLQISLISSLPRCSDELRDMLASKRKSPFKSGRTFGKLLTLLQFPRVHWDNLASRFAPAWGWNHKKEMAQFCRGLDSDQPYLSEELSDSESEAVLPTPRKTHGDALSNMVFSSGSFSDLDYEPPEADEDSEGTSDSDGPTNSQSISMYDKTETADDGNFSTHETLSSGLCPDGCGPKWPPKQLHTKEIIDLTSDNEETGSQRALRRDWPSDDGMYPDTPTPVEVRIPRPLEDRITSRFDLHGQMNMDLVERIRLWSHHGN